MDKDTEAWENKGYFGLTQLTVKSSDDRASLPAPSPVLSQSSEGNCKSGPINDSSEREISDPLQSWQRPLAWQSCCCSNDREGLRESHFKAKG